MALFTFDEFKKQEGTRPAEVPRTRQKKGFIRKAGEFLAPTTTGLITGEKKVTPKTVLGAAFEVGAFAIPTTAVLRGFGLARKAIGLGAKAVKGARAAKVARVAPKVPKLPSEAGPKELLTTFGKEARQFGKRVVSGAGPAAKVGGVAGGLLGAGRELGETDAGIKDVIGGAAIGATAGAIGGAVLAPAVSLATIGAKGLAGFTSKGIQRSFAKLQPQNRATTIETLANSYEKSYESSAVTKKLEKIWLDSRRKGGPGSSKELFTELSAKGIMPKIEGGLLTKKATRGNFIPATDELSGEIRAGLQEINRHYIPIKVTTPISVMKKRTAAEIADRIGIDTNTVNKEVNSIFKNIEGKFAARKGKLKATDLNDIRLELNKKTKSFNKPGQFTEDSKNIVAGVSRDILDNLVPGNIPRRLNAEIGKLGRMRETTLALHNEVVDVGFFSEALGRLLGTIGGTAGLTTFGLGGGVLGGGALVMAGVFAQLGSKAVATMIRRFRFNPQIMANIRRGMNADQSLKAKLIREATGADKALLTRFFSQQAAAATKTKPKTTFGGQLSKERQLREIQNLKVPPLQQ